MPSGKRIDWSQYDHLIIANLPKLTIVEWADLYASHISPKAIGARARKLGVKPRKYTPSKEHKESISKAISKETPEMVQYVKDNINSHSRNEIAKEIGLSPSNLSHLINRHQIKMTQKGRERARRASTEGNIGKVPWNKGGTLSDETKLKISEATSGENNGQYGREKTEEEKEKWRISWQERGYEKWLKWRRSDNGKISDQRRNAVLRSEEYVAAASERACELVRKGKIKFRGKPTKMRTKKGGNFTTKSSYETRFVELLEADDDVVSFIYEPFKIVYEFKGRKLNYVPDFLVTYVDGSEVICEVKPERLKDLPRNIAKFEAGMSHELDFRVISESDLGL
jgi:hypothetical protein